MRQPGRLPAAGRDSDIFECGPTSVLRRSRRGRSMVTEARTMAHAPGGREVIGPAGEKYPAERMDAATDESHDERIERRRRVVALIRAMHAQEDEKAESLIGELVGDHDLRRVIGSFGVAGSTLVGNLAAVKGVPAEQLLDELDEGMASAPVE